jgi:ribonuclease P protein component
MRLGRSRRLRKGPEFERVFKEGAATGGALLLVRHVPSELGYLRWGFAVGKKAAPRATRRNRLKRQLKAAVQSLEPDGSADIIVIARPAAVGEGFEALRKEAGRLLSRAGYLERTDSR